jgi:putative thiamine transport system substrate-binding protein
MRHSLPSFKQLLRALPLLAGSLLFTQANAADNPQWQQTLD